jgi:hypothetical protein
VVYRFAESLDGWAWTQYSSSSILDGTGIANGWVTVEQTSATGAMRAYGVLNDNVTNDGSFLLPPSTGTSNVLTVPVLVETPDFASELVLSNKGLTSVTLTLTYVESLATTGPSGGTATVTLRPAEQLVVPTAIDYLRRNGVPIGRQGDASYAGALRVAVSGGNISDVFAGARTATAIPGGGEFGLFTPCVYGGQEATDQAYLYGLQSNGANRTNVAVVHAGAPTDVPISLELQVFDGGKSGVAVGAPIVVTLSAGRWSQVSGILKSAGVSNGWVRVKRTAGAAPWIAYGVVNDGGAPGQRTGDGAYVPMTTLNAVGGDPAVTCTSFSILPPSVNATASAGSTPVAIIGSPYGCRGGAWSASASDSWLTVSPSSGTGPGLVTVGWTLNTQKLSRSGSAVIAGKAFSVMQAGE